MNKPATWLDVMNVAALLLAFIALEPIFSLTERLVIGVVAAIIGLILSILSIKKDDKRD